MLRVVIGRVVAERVIMVITVQVKSVGIVIGRVVGQRVIIALIV